VLDLCTLVVDPVAWAMWKNRGLASGSVWHALKLDVINIHFQALNRGCTERASAFHQIRDDHLDCASVGFFPGRLSFRPAFLARQRRLQQQSQHNERTRARKPRVPIPTTTTRKIHGASPLVQGEPEVSGWLAMAMAMLHLPKCEEGEVDKT